MRSYLASDQYLFEFNLHKKYARSELLLELIWTHCLIVSDIVKDLFAKKADLTQEINLGLATQAALLHDIGIYFCDGFEWLTGLEPTGKPYVQHTLTGAWVLKQEGLHPECIGCAHTHTGVGINSDDIHKFVINLPDGDYCPQTATQRLVAYAAKFHSKAPKFRTFDDIKKDLSRYGQEKLSRFNNLRAEFGDPDLERIIKKYADWHKGFCYEIEQLGNNLNLGLNSAGIKR